jgi:prepilin-type N-terminal cleavage/methylation domain-containing protein/prepilin-type processing-associated H-X9-DG protein
MKPECHSKSSGFTLIELLIVIAIIALLVSLLAPALSSAKDQARSAYCLSNLRNIGMAMHSYADANKEWIPRALDNDDAIWLFVFMPHIGSDFKKKEDYHEVKYYQCPAFPQDNNSRNQRSNARQTVDYVINAWDLDNPRLDSSEGGEQVDHPTKRDSVPFSSDLIYLADNSTGPLRPVILNKYELIEVSEWNILDVWSKYQLPGANREQANYHRRVAPDRHRREGCNNLFFDGHAKWLYTDQNTTILWAGKPEIP